MSANYDDLGDGSGVVDTVDTGQYYEDPLEGAAQYGGGGSGGSVGSGGLGSYLTNSEVRRRRGHLGSGGGSVKSGPSDLDKVDADLAKQKDPKLTYVPVEPTQEEAKSTGAAATSAKDGVVPSEQVMEDAASTSAQRTSTPENSPPLAGLEGQVAKSAADYFDTQPGTAKNANFPKYDFADYKQADAQAHAKAGGPNFEKYDRLTQEMADEAERIQHEGFGTKLLRVLAPRFAPSRGGHLADLERQRTIAKEQAFEQYLRNHPEASLPEEKFSTVDGALVSQRTGKPIYTSPNKPHSGAAGTVVDEGGNLVDTSQLPRDENGQIYQNVQIPNPTLAPDFMGPSLSGQPQLVTSKKLLRPRPPGAQKEDIDTAAKRAGAIEKARAPFRKQPESPEDVKKKAMAREAGKREGAGADSDNLQKAHAEYNKRMAANGKLDISERPSPKSVQNAIEKEYHIAENGLFAGQKTVTGKQKTSTGSSYEIIK